MYLSIAQKRWKDDSLAQSLYLREVMMLHTSRRCRRTQTQIKQALITDYPADPELRGVLDVWYSRISTQKPVACSQISSVTLNTPPRCQVTPEIYLNSREQIDGATGSILAEQISAFSFPRSHIVYALRCSLIPW